MVGNNTSTGVADIFPGPYLSWSFDFSPASFRAAFGLIHQTFTNEGPFDGVFGFSQGSAVIAAYLLEQAALHPEKPLPVSFGIFCSTPPILSTDPAYIQRMYGSLSAEDLSRLRSGNPDEIEKLPEPSRDAALMLVKSLAITKEIHGQSDTYFTDRPIPEIPCAVHPDVYKARLAIPTLHACSNHDPVFMQQTSALCGLFCEAKSRRSFKHSAIHSLPRVPTEAKEMAAMMDSVASWNHSSL